MKTVVVNRFDGNMVNDPRSSAVGACQVCQHFDSFTNKHKLTPYRSAETGDSSASTNQIANYAYIGGTLYGNGIASGSGFTKLFTRTNFTDAVWTADAGGYSLASARADADLPFFIYYKTTGKIYGVRAGQFVYSVVPATSANATEKDLSTYTNVSNGVVHSKDDVLYVGYDNKIAKNNNGSWTAPALTLPTDFIITSICEYGNYLAIAARSSKGLVSRVWLWDRDATLTTLSESIDWGEGNLMVLEELAGYLIGVSFVGTTGSFNFQSRVAFRSYSGSGGAQLFEQFVGFSQSPAISAGLGSAAGTFKQKVNSRILFSANIPIVTTSYTGIWAIAKTDTGFSVALDRLPTTTSSTFLPYGLIQLGDYVFFSYSNSATFAMDKTDDVSNYTTTSVYESVINPNMPEGDKVLDKELMTVAVAMTPLTSGQQVVIKYKVDGGSWTSIATITTVGQTVYEATQASAQFSSGREFEFHIESTGGAEITGFAYKHDANETAL